MIWVDGVFVDSVFVDGVIVDGDDASTCPSLFETMGRFAGALPLWERHLLRLRASMQQRRDDAPWPSGLHAAALHLLAVHGDHSVLRLERRLPPHASFRLATRPRAPAGLVRLLPTVTARPADAPPADQKATPRAFYDAVLGQARAGSADDGIILGDDGALLETAVCNLWLLLGGIWVTPPLDGRVLPGIARALLLERALGAGVAVAERACDLADLHKATALCVSNAVHGPRPAALLGSAAAQSDNALVRIWQTVVPD